MESVGCNGKSSCYLRSLNILPLGKLLAFSCFANALGLLVTIFFCSNKNAMLF
jgi:hypothetical protein